MKTLVVFYSRTGTTKKVAEKLADKLSAESEEIIDTLDRSGIMGFLYSGRDAMRRRLTKIEAPQKNPADFDLVIIGTPIWAWNVSAPVRTYLTQQREKLPQVAFFCTMGGSGYKKVFREMYKIIRKKPKAFLYLTTQEVTGISEIFKEKLNSFTKKLQN